MPTSAEIIIIGYTVIQQKCIFNSNGIQILLLKCEIYRVILNSMQTLKQTFYFDTVKPIYGGNLLIVDNLTTFGLLTA